MSCINPIQLKVNDRYSHKLNIEVPCGHCLNCMIKKQSQIEFLAKKELLENYKLNKSASFVTLTYDDSHLPINEYGFSTLLRSDVQKFIKNMRRQIEYYGQNLSFKYLYCGEYGDGSHSTSRSGVSTCRPHYHIVFIGLSPEQVRAYTKKLWRFGLCDVGPLSAGGIRYLCKYMTKTIPDKEVKAIRAACGVQNPFFYHSVGLGKKWIDKNLSKIVEDSFTFNLNGKLYPYPKYVLQYVTLHTGISYKPYIRKGIIDSTLYKKCQSSNISYYDTNYDENFIKYKYKVAALRSQNKPINDFTLSKKWIKPRHSFDRSLNFNYNYILDIAKYGDVVPF